MGILKWELRILKELDSVCMYVITSTFEPAFLELLIKGHLLQHWIRSLQLLYPFVFNKRHPCQNNYCPTFKLPLK